MGKNHACLISPPFLDSGTVVTKYIDVLLVAQNLTLNQNFYKQRWILIYRLYTAGKP